MTMNGFLSNYARYFSISVWVEGQRVQYPLEWFAVRKHGGVVDRITTSDTSVRRLRIKMINICLLMHDKEPCKDFLSNYARYFCVPVRQLKGSISFMHLEWLAVLTK